MIHYEQSGQGHPIVLLHGVAASLRDWDSLRSVLDRRGFHVYALDLLGHGESPKPRQSGAYRAEALVDLLDGFLDEVIGRPPYTLLGHSLGGYLSLAYALRKPTLVWALILVNPVFRPDQLSPAIQLVRRRPAWGSWALRNAPPWLVEVLAGWRPIGSKPIPREARKQLAVDYRRAAPEVVHIPKSFQDLSQQVRGIQSPAFVVWGEQDRTLDPASYHELVQYLPNAEGQSFPQCGHQPHLATPDAFEKSVVEFLQRLGR